MNDQKFEVGDAIRFGWDTTRANLNLVVILTLVAGLATGVPSAIAEGFERWNPVLSLFFRLLASIVSVVVSIGAIRIALRLHDGGSVAVRDLFAVDWPLFWRYLLATVLYTLIVLVGLLLLIVPGVIFSVRYAFYGYFVVERNARPLEAMSQSAAATRGAWWNVSLLGLALILLNILGAIALLVGLLITIPVSAIAAAWVYRRLAGAGSSVGASTVGQPSGSSAD